MACQSSPSAIRIQPIGLRGRRGATTAATTTNTRTATENSTTSVSLARFAGTGLPRVSATNSSSSPSNPADTRTRRATTRAGIRDRTPGLHQRICSGYARVQGPWLGAWMLARPAAPERRPAQERRSAIEGFQALEVPLGVGGELRDGVEQGFERDLGADRQRGLVDPLAGQWGHGPRPDQDAA
jgi:hypothetical protein